MSSAIYAITIIDRTNARPPARPSAKHISQILSMVNTSSNLCACVYFFHFRTNWCGFLVFLSVYVQYGCCWCCCRPRRRRNCAHYPHEFDRISLTNHRVITERFIWQTLTFSMNKYNNRIFIVRFVWATSVYFNITSVCMRVAKNLTLWWHDVFEIVFLSTRNTSSFLLHRCPCNFHAFSHSPARLLSNLHKLWWILKVILVNDFSLTNLPLSLPPGIAHLISHRLCVAFVVTPHSVCSEQLLLAINYGNFIGCCFWDCVFFP